MDNYSWSHGWDCGLVCKDVRSSSWTSNELCYQSWWALHYLISLRLKKKKEGWGREKMKAYILSAMNGKRWSRIILDYYFFYLIHWCSLCHWEACQLQKQSEVIFCTGMWLAEGLCQSLSWSCQQARGKSPKKEMLTLLCVSYSTRLRWSACKRASCPIIRKQWR